MDPWDADYVVDVEQARALIRDQVPQVEADDVTLLGAGFDNTVMLVDQRWAFRFPRRGKALPLNEREARLLPLVADVVTLPVPRPDFTGVMDVEPVDGVPWRFFGGPLVPGTELAVAALPEDRRAPLARALGGFLGRLHAIDAQTRSQHAAAADLPLDPNSRNRPLDRKALMDSAVERLTQVGLWERGSADDRRLGDLLDDAYALEPPDEPVLVHGDLHVRHVLVEGGAASGVIDWGDTCLADASLDLSIAWTAFAPAERDQLLETYRDAGGVDVTQERATRARVLGLNLALALSAYAHSVQDGRLLAETLAGARRALR